MNTVKKKYDKSTKLQSKFKQGEVKKKTDKNSISHLIRKLLGSNEIFAVYVTIISFPRT